MAEEFGISLNMDATKGDIRYQFTEESFNEALQTYGLKNLANALVERASATQPDDFKFTYKDLEDGTASFLDYSDEFTDMSRDDRKAYFSNPEAILSLFSNIEDYGKYDPKTNTLPGLEAISEEFVRKQPVGMGIAEGMLIGAKVGKKLATKIPPRSPAAVGLRALLYGGSTLVGAAAGGYLGEEISDAAFGDKTPILPSLRPAENFGETGALALNPSSLSNPFRWTTDKTWLGASTFLNNYRNVNKGNWKDYGNSFLLTSKAAGLTEKQFKLAQNASQGRNILQGQLFDPSKGPVPIRVLSTFEKAIPGVTEFAKKHPIVSLAFDFTSGVGAATAALGAEASAPGSEGTRFLYELIGAAVPGPAIELGVKGALSGGRRVKDSVLRYFNEDGVKTLRDETAMRRIYEALEKSGKVTDDSIELLNNILLAEAKLIDEGAIPKQNVALTAVEGGSELGPALVAIENNVARTLNELSVSSKKGREAWIQASKQNIIDMSNSGDPTLIKLSGLISKGYFENALNSDLTRRVNNLYEALEKITKGDAKELSKYDVSERLYDRLKSFVDDSYNIEKKFWKGVGDFEITEFRTRDGDVLEAPNIISLFEKPASQGGLKFASETGTATFWSNLPAGTRADLDLIFQYFGRNAEGVVSDNADAANTVAPQSNAINKAYKALQESIDKISGGQNAKFLQEEIDDAAKLSPQEKVEYFRKKAENLRERATRKEFDDNQGIRKYATALDNVASLEAIKIRESSEQAFKSGSIDASEMDNPVTSARLMEMRTSLLEQAANLRSGLGKRGNSATAERLDRLSNAILNDLVSQDTDSVPYNLARAYTFARRDLSERTFLGDLGASDTLGRLKLGPENALNFLLQGGSDAVVRRMNEVELINKFVKEEMGLSETAAKDFSGDFNQAFENAFRYVTSKITVQKADPTNPEILIDVVDPKKLRSFKEDPANQLVLRTFPNIAKDLKNVETAQKALSSIDPSKFFKQNETYRALQLAADMGGETPQKFVAKLLASDNPFSDLNSLIRTVENQQKIKILRGGDIKITEKPRTDIFDAETGSTFSVADAKGGLKNAILNYAITRGGNEGSAMSPRVVFDTLFVKPPNVADSKNTLMSWMTKNNIMSKEDSNLVRQYLREMINVEEAFTNNNLEEIMFKKPTLAKKNFVKMFGATLGQKSQETLNNILKKVGLGTEGSGIGGGMVAAQSGSESSQDFFLIAPEMAIAKSMQAMLENPQKFSDVLLEVQNAKQLAAAEKSFADKMAEFGVNQIGKRQAVILRALLFSEEEFEPQGLETEPEPETEEESQVIPSVPATNQRASLIPRTETPTIRPTVDPRRAAAPAPIVPNNVSQPATQSRYAALFPNDPISSMIRNREGIGSLI
jgi:hypothetical protein